jgi:hypothetical protein
VVFEASPGHHQALPWLIMTTALGSEALFRDNEVGRLLGKDPELRAAHESSLALRSQSHCRLDPAGYPELP